MGNDEGHRLTLIRDSRQLAVWGKGTGMSCDQLCHPTGHASSLDFIDKEGAWTW